MAIKVLGMALRFVIETYDDKKVQKHYLQNIEFIFCFNLVHYKMKSILLII
jgi:hypothetical protein